MPETTRPHADKISDFHAEKDHVSVEMSDTGVATVVLSYVERRNAMSAAMTSAFDRLLPALASDPNLRAVLITGEGTAFCSGGDTGWIGSDPDASIDQLRKRMMAFYRSWLAIRDIPVPVVMGINGPAVGAGACIALAGDVRIAAQAARFSVPFLRLGMHPGMATTYLLPEVVGVAAARDLLYTGRSIDADEMLRLGIVSQVLPDEGFAGAMAGIAEQVAATAPVAARLLKAGLRDGGPRSLEDSVQWEAMAQPITLATADLQEGLAAAREKRPAKFAGN